MQSLFVHPNHYKKSFNFFLFSIRMLNLTLNELNLVVKSRGIRDYENKSEKRH